MNRLAIFASYDKKGIVHDYLITYLKELKQVADKIIFIADNYTNDEEKQKLKKLVDFCDFTPHGEYDFGSYKRGYIYAENHGLLEQADELILCNDSCFCISSFIPVFETMDKKKCDFWGMSANKTPIPHLQSYFLVFKKNVFRHREFANWIKNVARKDNVDSVIKDYEVPLTSFLEDIGFKSDAFIKHQEKINPTIKPLTLLKQNFPFIKRKIFSEREASNESVRKVLAILNMQSKISYDNICNYYKTMWSKFFPIILPRDFEALVRFLYQKKITKSGKLRIKICKISVYSRKLI